MRTTTEERRNAANGFYNPFATERPAARAVIATSYAFSMLPTDRHITIAEAAAGHSNVVTLPLATLKSQLGRVVSITVTATTGNGTASVTDGVSTFVLSPGTYDFVNVMNKYWIYLPVFSLAGIVSFSAIVAGSLAATAAIGARDDTPSDTLETASIFALIASLLSRVDALEGET